MAVVTRIGGKMPVASIMAAGFLTFIVNILLAGRHLFHTSWPVERDLVISGSAHPRAPLKLERGLLVSTDSGMSARLHLALC